jgi:L,D-transpeptidase YcbB
VGPGPTLRLGDRGERVGLLRERLLASGDLAPGPGLGAPGGSPGERNAEEAESFDTGLEEAVLRFQRGHGLLADGIVGPQTLAALEVPISARIRQVEGNLGRQRGFEPDPTGPHLVVNIPGFSLDVVAAGDVLLTQRAIIGTCLTPTPVFHSEILFLTLNPVWGVPRSIARRTVIPNAARDPSYLQRQGFRVFRLPGGQEVDPRSVDWKAQVGREPVYSFRQNPGPANALGRVRFSFPTRYGVALHGTPDLHLFERPARDFSSGCIRVEDPVGLAELLLAGDGGWSREALETIIARGTTLDIPLAAPVPLDTVYWTAWVDEGGRLQLRDDVYDRDH